MTREKIHSFGWRFRSPIQFKPIQIKSVACVLLLSDSIYQSRGCKCLIEKIKKRDPNKNGREKRGEREKERESFEMVEILEFEKDSKSGRLEKNMETKQTMI